MNPELGFKSGLGDLVDANSMAGHMSVSSQIQSPLGGGLRKSTVDTRHDGKNNISLLINYKYTHTHLYALTHYLQRRHQYWGHFKGDFAIFRRPKTQGTSMSKLAPRTSKRWRQYLENY